MAVNREQLQNTLLDELRNIERKAGRIREMLAANAAYLGEGIEFEPKFATSPIATGKVDDIMAYLELEDSSADMSDYIGSEGHSDTRPKLGADAPQEIRPQKEPVVSPLVPEVIITHPNDSVSMEIASPVGLALTTEPNGPQSVQHAEQIVIDAKISSSVAGRETDDTLSAKTSTEASSQTKSSGLYLVKPIPSPGDSKDAPDYSRAALALQAINDGIWDWNMQKGTTYFSPRWYAIVGGGEMQSRSPLESVLQCLEVIEGDPLVQSLEDLMLGRITRLTAQVRIKRSSTMWGWGMFRAICLRDAAGTPLRIVAALADNTAQYEAEQALHASEEKYRALAELSVDFIGRFDRAGKFLYASPSVNRYAGVSHDEVIGKHVGLVLNATTSEMFLRHLHQVFVTGLPVQMEAQLQSAVIGQFVADCRFWPEFGPDGEVVSVTTQMRDMTFSRRLADNYQALFTSMVDGFALFEHVPQIDSDVNAYEARDFILVAMNPALAKMLNIDAAEAIGLRLCDLMGKDANTLTTLCLRLVLRGKRAVLSSFRSMETNILFDVSAYTPEPGRVACIFKDVTVIHDIAQDVRLNEARLAALYRLSHMDDAAEAQVVQFSLDQAVQLTGSRSGCLYIAPGAAETKAQTYWSQDLLKKYGAHVDRSMNLLLDLNPLQPIIENNYNSYAPIAGEEMPIARYMVAPVLEDGRVVCFAVVANKSEEYEKSDLRQLELFINGMWFQLRRRWAVEALLKAKEQAEAASRAKNEFLANVSHELRTPLSGILGMLQLLQQSDLTENQMEYVVTANYSGRSLLRIISDILDFSRIEAGRFVLEPQVFDLAATLRSTLGMFVHQAEQKNIRFTLQMSDNIPKLLMGDDARVRQIVFNLVGNAFKFTEQGEITVKCSLLPHCFHNKYCVYFAVKDTGVGIPDEKLEHIFQAFTQLDGSNTRRYPGTGLGLAIVQRLVHLMNGTLSIESALGEGTTIHCSLPFGEATGALAVSDEHSIDYSSVPPLSILVAEDDATNRFTIRGLLEKAGHNVICVNDGHQALEALLLQSFDCLITDIQMPVMDGVEVIGRIRQGRTADIIPTNFVYSLLGKEKKMNMLRAIPVDLPVIALTAHVMSGDREHFLGLGMDYYLAKPIIASELHSILYHVAIIVSARSHK